MNIRKHLVLLATLLVTVFCGTAEPFEPSELPGAVTIDATVYESSSCWLLGTDDALYQAVGLDPTYQVNGLKVRASVRQPTGGTAVGCAGIPVIEVLAIARR